MRKSIEQQLKSENIQFQQLQQLVKILKEKNLLAIYSYIQYKLSILDNFANINLYAVILKNNNSINELSLENFKRNCLAYLKLQKNFT